MTYNVQCALRFGGAKAARIYRNLRQRLHIRDAHCVAKAHKYNLPGWIGHLPIYLFVGSSVIALLLGSLAIAIMVILAFVLLLGISQNMWNKKNSNINEQKAAYEHFSWEQDWDKDTYKRHSWESDDC
ncbi:MULTISPECIES: hypothetical protein [unclassified Photorhabdus]|uniref:hypothetical protein n=1 Tax=unclassified Photorhabdus TaxID=2620880 RepID=UPI000DCBF7AE|nr:MULTISPECIES: hypothetical protein [unclassified Photorhabdus]RAW93161.1 hypothetical protein CKY03_22500 [Photorhabdus sp. S9-53]RAW93177.1 hypothetical protein CKY05_22505 [Photorhabdus sp. S10-54]RAW96644.1 hypothetical protein CKY04_22525 [Photorhabdus sp. S8-52]